LAGVILSSRALGKSAESFDFTRLSAFFAVVIRKTLQSISVVVIS